jgi:uncharacterized protein (TIGR00730 family)
MIKNLCVYCGTSNTCDEIYQNVAIKLGELIAHHKYNLVYGAGIQGLMGLLANSTLSNNGKIYGVTTPVIIEQEGVHKGLTKLYIENSMHIRKFKMAGLADAFIILPGGFGTLDEFFEVLTCRQLAIHTKPIIILNINNYWDPLIQLIQEIITKKFAKKEHAEFIHVAETPELVFTQLQLLNTPRKKL